MEARLRWKSGSQVLEGAKHHGRYQKGCSVCQNCEVQASLSGLLAVCLITACYVSGNGRASGDEAGPSESLNNIIFFFLLHNKGTIELAKNRGWACDRGSQIHFREPTGSKQGLTAKACHTFAPFFSSFPPLDAPCYSTLA